MSFWKPRVDPKRDQFEAFYRRTVKPLAAHLRQIGLRDTTELEEVLQEAYVEAHKCWHSLQDQDKAMSWMFTIGRRQFFKWLERQKRERLYRDDQEHEMVVEHDQTTDLDHQSLIQNVMTHLRAIKNPTRQEAVRLFFLEEWSLAEISRKQETKVSTLTTWMNRFRDQVKGDKELQVERSSEPVNSIYAMAMRKST